MNNNVKILAGSAADLAQVTEMWCDLVNYHVRQDDRLPALAPEGAQKWSGRLGKLLEDPTCRLFVAKASPADQLVGFVTGFLQYAPQVFEPRKTGKVADIFVAPGWRQQQIARRLLIALTEWFQREQVDRIEMSIAIKNPVSVSFWQSLGAQPYMMQMLLPVDWQARLSSELRTEDTYD